MIEESKIISMIRSFEDGRAIQVEALALANARTEEQMKNVKDKLDDINVVLSSNTTKMDALLNKMDERYASKLTEKIVYATCGVFLVGIIGALSILIFPHKAQAVFISLANLTN